MDLFDSIFTYEEFNNEFLRDITCPDTRDYIVQTWKSRKKLAIATFGGITVSTIGDK